MIQRSVGSCLILRIHSWSRSTPLPVLIRIHVRIWRTKVPPLEAAYRSKVSLAAMVKPARLLEFPYQILTPFAESSFASVPRTNQSSSSTIARRNSVSLVVRRGRVESAREEQSSIGAKTEMVLVSVGSAC